MPPATVLDAETILTATEDVLRRHGPAKATVLDVARALGVSHASVYRHFPSKAALREAVTRRWLSRTHDDLAQITRDTQLAPPERLRAWLTALFTVKRARVTDDPELFATYRTLAAEHRKTATDHVAELLEQLRSILADGIASGEFAITDLDATAQAAFDATTRFHHPAHATEWQAADIDTDFNSVCTLIIDALRAQ